LKNNEIYQVNIDKTNCAKLFLWQFGKSV
jgi:hypothetical protein